MSYVECARCGMTAFSVAYRFTVEYCPRCGARLPHPRTAFEPARGAFSVPSERSGDPNPVHRASEPHPR